MHTPTGVQTNMNLRRTYSLPHGHKKRNGKALPAENKKERSIGPRG